MRVEGSLIGLKYNDKVYYYIKNMQEDIIGITDENFNKIVEYEYDSWGNIITIKDNNGNIITDESHIGIINPFRYRSYYYDKETKLYYLNSRYYNPEWGRFINADNYINTNQGMYSLNMYTYTENNFINRLDTEGIFWFVVARSLVRGAISAALTTINNIVSGNDYGEGVWQSFVAGMFSGAISAIPLNFKKYGNILMNYGSALIESILNGSNILNVFLDTIINGTLGITSKDVYNIGETWIRPETFSTSFTGKYQQKMTINDVVSGYRASSVTNQYSITQNMYNEYHSKIQEKVAANAVIGALPNPKHNNIVDGVVNGLINNTRKKSKIH